MNALLHFKIQVLEHKVLVTEHIQNINGSPTRKKRILFPGNKFRETRLLGEHRLNVRKIKLTTIIKNLPVLPKSIMHISLSAQMTPARKTGILMKNHVIYGDQPLSER